MTARTDLAPLFRKKLLVVSGKGGTGKTTVAAALASLAAASGRTVLLLSTDGRGDAATYFGRDDPGYRETELEPSLYGLTSDFDALLENFVESVVPVRLIGRRLLASATFRYFTRATPGLPDVLILGKIRELGRRAHPKRGAPKYDLVVLDAPATGHALSMLGIPRTLLKTIPAGPMRKLATELNELLSDREKTSLVVVAEPAELAAREAEELVEGAKKNAGITTGLLVVNRIGRGGRSPKNKENARDSVPEVPEGTPLIEIPEIEADDEEDFFERFRDALQSSASRRKRGFEETSIDESPGRGAQRVKGERSESPKAHPLDARAPQATRSEAKSLSLLPWLGESKLLVLTGPGGTGKTTLSAAAGIAAARAGRRVLVLTVDPARRLAQALGLSSREGRSDKPVRVRLGGLPTGASFSALQIDPKATFERLLARVASPTAVERIRGNRLYAGLVDSLPGVLEYMGVEALWEHAQDPAFDLIVLDTPPAARGLDFLSAPDRMVQLLENDALRWFLKSDSLLGRALSGASRGAATILRLADKALGFGFLADLADFFRAFEGLYEGFARRSREISALLGNGRFIVVSSLDRSALRTAEETAKGLIARGAAPGLILNRLRAGAPKLRLPENLRTLPCGSLEESDVAAADLPSFLAEALSR